MHVTDAPGVRVVVGQLIGDNVPVPENDVPAIPESATLTFDIVTLPVFVTRNE